jgi:hypothetical protein
MASKDGVEDLRHQKNLSVIIRVDSAGYGESRTQEQSGGLSKGKMEGVVAHMEELRRPGFVAPANCKADRGG